MNQQQRQQHIMLQLRALQGELTVDELASSLAVSPLTIRRDLDCLERMGAVLRTHGGCVLRTSVASVYHQKVALNFGLKERIGKAAVREVEDDSTIIIHDGSTPFHLACQLGSQRLTVFTNSVSVINELSRFPSIRLCLLGGEYNAALNSIGGSITEAFLENLRADAVFLGTDAVDDQGCCLISDANNARLTRSMMRCARRTILLADHTKVGAVGHYVFARLSEIDAWYTTAGIKPSVLRAFEKDTTVHVV